jgi:hypothetical protein
MFAILLNDFFDSDPRVDPGRVSAVSEEVYATFGTEGV